jgi:hypothetical protein
VYLTALTPWTSDIDGGGFNLTNVHNITATNSLNVTVLNSGTGWTLNADGTGININPYLSGWNIGHPYGSVGWIGRLSGYPAFGIMGGGFSRTLFIGGFPNDDSWLINYGDAGSPTSGGFGVDTSGNIYGGGANITGVVHSETDPVFNAWYNSGNPTVTTLNGYTPGAYETWYNSGSPTLSNLTITGLTQYRIPFAGTAGLLGDSANLIFKGNKLGISSTPDPQKTFTTGVGGAFAVEMAPGNPSLTSITLSGGNIADGTYYYVQTASDGFSGIGAYNLTETVRGQEITVVVSGGGGHAQVRIALDFTPAGSTFINLYRTTTPGVYPANSFVGRTGVSNAHYIDDTTATGSLGGITPASTTTAFSTIISGSGTNYFFGGSLLLCDLDPNLGILQLGNAGSGQYATITFDSRGSYDDLIIKNNYSGTSYDRILLQSGATTIAKFTATGQNFYGTPQGTLAFPPPGLASGDLWADTTTSAANPIVRLHL